jgi:hypothetical protein
MPHATIVTLLFILTVALHPSVVAIALYPHWSWTHEIGVGPFVGALTILIVIVVLRTFWVI